MKAVKELTCDHPFAKVAEPTPFLAAAVQYRRSAFA
jgi:hypothetical protein